MGFVDRARDDAVVRLRTELRMAAVRIVADISEEFRLARPRREDERPSRDRDEDLSRALLLDLAALLERLLVKYADHVSRPLVDDDLFLAELLPGRRHAIPALELRERDLEDAAEQVAERIADVRLGRRLWSAALRAHAIGRRRIRPAVDALVAEPLRDVDGRFFGIDEIPFRAREPVLLLQDLVALFDFDEGPFRILRIVHDSDLFRHRRQMEGEGLGDHRLARAGRADQQEVPPLIRGDPGERDRLVLADDPLQRIVRDRDLRGRLKVVEGEPLIRGDHPRSRDRLHPGYGARSLRVQTSMPAGCFVIVPIFVPTTECMFISDAMSRMRCVMIPSKTTARVCFAVLSVSTSSRTGTSVTTPSSSSRRRAVEDPPSCRSMSRYFSSFGLTIFAGFPRFSRLPRFRTELRSRLRTRLGPSRGLRLRELRLGLVDLAGEAVHLDVLVCGNLVPQALHDLVLRELLDFLASRGARDEVDFRHLEEFFQDQISTAVSVDEGGERPFFRELLNRLRDVRPLDGDRVLDPRSEEV